MSTPDSEQTAECHTAGTSIRHLSCFLIFIPFYLLALAAVYFTGSEILSAELKAEYAVRQTHLHSGDLHAEVLTTARLMPIQATRSLLRIQQTSRPITWYKFFNLLTAVFSTGILLLLFAGGGSLPYITGSFFLQTYIRDSHPPRAGPCEKTGRPAYLQKFFLSARLHDRKMNRHACPTGIFAETGSADAFREHISGAAAITEPEAAGMNLDILSNGS